MNSLKFKVVSCEETKEGNLSLGVYTEMRDIITKEIVVESTESFTFYGGSDNNILLKSLWKCRELNVLDFIKRHNVMDHIDKFVVSEIHRFGYDKEKRYF